MAQHPKPVQHGTVNGTPLVVDMSRLDHATTRKVTLTQPYDRTCPPGTPAPPSMTGCAVANLNRPRTIPSGTVLTLQPSEAAALVAAGAAVYS